MFRKPRQLATPELRHSVASRTFKRKIHVSPGIQNIEHHSQMAVLHVSSWKTSHAGDCDIKTIRLDISTAGTHARHGHEQIVLVEGDVKDSLRRVSSNATRHDLPLCLLSFGVTKVGETSTASSTDGDMTLSQDGSRLLLGVRHDRLWLFSLRNAVEIPEPRSSLSQTLPLKKTRPPFPFPFQQHNSYGDLSCLPFLGLSP